MNEGRQVVAGEAILSGAATTDRSKNDRTKNDRTKDDHNEDERIENECSQLERDYAVLEALVREHSRLVYRIAYAVLRRHHDAEDATQEAFMRVLRYSSKLADGGRSRRCGWRASPGALRSIAAASAAASGKFR